MSKAYFKIEGEFITEHVRNLWAEGSYGKALEFLDVAFTSAMTLDQQYGIITGKLKLVGVNDVDLVEDDWQPDLDRCAYGQYPDPKQLGALAADGNKLKYEKKQDLLFEAENLVEKFKDLRWCDGELAEEYRRQYELFPQDIRDQVGELSTYQRFATDFGTASAGATVMLDTFIQRQKVLETAPLPAVDNELESEHGWITPNGKFYPCGYMEHIWLAGMLGFDEEKKIEQTHVKISTGKMGVNIVEPIRGANQKQINTVFDWCQRHKASALPRWAGGIAL